MGDISGLDRYLHSEEDEVIGISWVDYEVDDNAFGSGSGRRTPALAQDSPDPQPSPSDDSQNDIEDKVEDPNKIAKTKDTTRTRDPLICEFGFNPGSEFLDDLALSVELEAEADEPEWSEVSDEPLEQPPEFSQELCENSGALLDLDISPRVSNEIEQAGHVSPHKRKSSHLVRTEAEIEIIEPGCSYLPQYPTPAKAVDNQGSFKDVKASRKRSEKKEKVKKPKMYELDPIEHPEALGSIKQKAQRDSKKLANQTRDKLLQLVQHKNQELTQRYEQLEATQSATLAENHRLRGFLGQNLELVQHENQQLTQRCQNCQQLEATQSATLAENHRLLGHIQQLLTENQQVRVELHRLQVGSLNPQNR